MPTGKGSCKVWCETCIPTHFNETKVVWDLLNVKEFAIHHSFFQIPRFLVNLPDNNYYLVSIVLRPHMYFLVASCNVTTFTRMDQVQEGVNLFWRQNFIVHSLKTEKISTSIFQSYFIQKCKITIKL